MAADEIGEKVLRAIRRERVLRLHAPRAPGGAAGDLRRDDRRIPRRAGAGGPARGRGGPARRQGERARLLAGRLMREVEGKTAFVTGGASGIGLGMATAFADAGMNVVIADLRRDHIETALATTRRRGAACTRSSSTSPTATGFARAADEAEQRLRQRARALQQRRHGYPRPGRARALRRLGLGPRRAARRRRERHPDVRAAHARTRRRWPHRQHVVDGGRPAGPERRRSTHREGGA